jgi:hypothetical protein
VFLEAKVDSLSFLSIDADESIWLEREFEKEVWDVVRDMNGDKASGLDSLTMAEVLGNIEKRILWMYLRNSIIEVSLRKVVILLLFL